MDSAGSDESQIEGPKARELQAFSDAIKGRSVCKFVESNLSLDGNKIVFAAWLCEQFQRRQDANDAEREKNLFSGVEDTFTPSSLLVMVPVLSSAARIPLPFSKILSAILFSSDILT